MATKTKARKTKVTEVPRIGESLTLRITQGDIKKAYKPERCALTGCLIATTAKRVFPKEEISCGLRAISIAKAKFDLGNSGEKLVDHWCNFHTKKRRPKPQTITLTRIS